jgi:hypothetical protein
MSPPYLCQPLSLCHPLYIPPSVPLLYPSLGLYVDRVNNEMKTRGLLGLERKLDASELVSFTCLNYSGSTGCQRAIDFIKLGQTSNLLDVGCGVGKGIVLGHKLLELRIKGYASH